MKVLVVDDSPSSLAYHGELVRQMGLEVVAARGGLEALACYRAEVPDFILLDVEMPGLDGFEVARRIRADEPPDQWTPIIFLTGLSNEESLSRGIAAGGDDYLNKPVSELVLMSKMSALRRINRIRQTLLERTEQLSVANQRLNDANEKLATMAAIDGLTGIANRRRFDEVLSREWARSMREKTSLSLLIADVDFFKLYNDSYGHQAGDVCLKSVAQAIAHAVMRPGDVAARYGGEEFAVVLANTPLEGARLVAQRALENIQALHMDHKASKVSPYVTASFGVATLNPSPGGESGKLLGLADRALYEAKERGRARIVWAGQAPT